MNIAACDPDSFYPLRSLVQGPFTDLSDLLAVERFIRTVVLHDEIVMELDPWPYHPDPDADLELSDEEEAAGGRSVIVAVGPVLTGFDFFADRQSIPPIPNIELDSALLEIAANFSNAGGGNVYFNAHVAFLKRVLGIVEQGGSALLCSGLGQAAIKEAQRYPQELFRKLDLDWQRYAQQLANDGVRLVVPPILGIILTRAARREAIPAIIRDLRDEWANARQKVWNLLRALRNSHTLTQALEIQRELSDASLLFSPELKESDTEPIRILWSILAAVAAGAAAAKFSGGRPLIGAATGGVSQIARSVSPSTREIGREIFGRGAFDLARRVRQGTAQINFDALGELLSEPERRNLGLS